MTAMGGGPSHPPMPTEWSLTDLVGAMSFHGTIVSALLARGRSGKGQPVQTSQTSQAAATRV